MVIYQAKENADELVQTKAKLDAEATEMKKVVNQTEQTMRTKAGLIGNLVHDSVPVSQDEVRFSYSLNPYLRFTLFGNCRITTRSSGNGTQTAQMHK